MRFHMSAHWLRTIALALVTLLAAGCGTGDGEESVSGSDSDANPANLRLVFRDDFGGPAAVPRGPGIAAMSPPAPLPPGDWVVETGYGQNGWGNDEWQRYTSSMDNVFIANGNLVLRAQCATAPTCGKRDDTITSGKVITKNRLNVRYGRIRARIKMPSGLGMWPAFWTLGSDIDSRPWPDAGEIDIVEMHYFYSDVFTTHFTTHWSGPRYSPTTRPACASGVGSSLDPTEEENCATATKTFDTPLTDDYHIFELDWNENRIVGKIDGITYFQQAIDAGTMEEFLKNHYLILNVAVGGTLGGPFGPSMSATDWTDPDQTDMKVDWVEVWEQVPPQSATLDYESANKLRYNRIINSAEFNGAFVESKKKSTAVTPLAGSSVLELIYSNSVSPNGGVPASFSGAIFDFNQINLSSFTNFVFSLDTSRFPNLDDIGIEFEDSQRNKVLVRTGNYVPVATSGKWKTYSIPLADFAGVDMNDIVAIGFFNPFDGSDNLIAGTLYVDNILFTTQACSALPVVGFDAINYNPATSVAQVTVNDACAANKLVTVKVENGSDEIYLGVKLDAAGNGSTVFGLISAFSACSTNDEISYISQTPPLMASYTSPATSESAFAMAGTDPGAPDTTLEGDALYIYATDPSQPLAFIPDLDFRYSDFGSGSNFNGNFTGDPTFNPVFSVSDLANEAAVLAHFQFTPGFTAGKDSINFKIKNMPGNIVLVKFGDADPDFEVDLVNDTEFSTPIGATGWYDVSIPMSNFPTVDAYSYLVIKSNTSSPVDFTFLVTDIFLRETIEVVPPECAAPVAAPDAPTEDPADVISLFSNAYSDVMVDTWSTVWDSTEAVDGQLQGNDVKRYDNLGFAGIETVTAPIDASLMTNFRIDVWSVGITTLRIKIVDFGGDGFDPGIKINDTEGFVDIPVKSAEWTNVNVSLADLVTAGLTPAKDDISQFILEAVGGTGTLFIDNVYFFDDGSGGGPGDDELLTNGDFETSAADKAPWINAGGVVTNNYYEVDVVSPDPSQPFLVNLSQVVPITPSETYVLTFRARASVNRTMIAGIGLNGGPGGCCDFRNNSEVVSLTTEWQTFSYTLQAVDDTDGSPFGDNVSRVLFDMNGEAGTVNIDDVSLEVQSTPGELLTNGDFETSAADKAPWINAGGVVTNNYYEVDVVSPDPSQPFLVNLSQVVPITPSETYVLTFRARASVNRTMIAGIGLNGGPGGCCDFRNNSEVVSLTTEWQTFSYTLQAVDDTDGSPFGDNVSRVLFDMNGEAGTVNIDDVSLKVDSGGGGSGTEIAVDGDFEAGDLTVNWFVVPNGTNGTANADNTLNNGGNWSARFIADENVGASLVVQQNGMGIGTVMPGDSIDVSFDAIGTVTAGCAINAQLISNGGGGISGSLSPAIDVATDLSTWGTFSFTATTAGPVDVNGVLLEFIVGCGAGTGGVVDVNLDNVSVSIQ